MPSNKLHRWLDLLAALLSRRNPATFLDLARDVPAYLDDGSVNTTKPSETLKRMFERDKDELRELGVPIMTLGSEGDDDTSYQLRKGDFYLPYLAVASERGIQEPAKVATYGYGSLARLTFEPDELQAIREGAHRAIQAGDSSLADHARSALQKLAFDLPLGATDGASSDGVIIPSAAQADPKVLVDLGEALLKRKKVTLRYRGMKSADEEQRNVEPYGLFFLNGHWYLAARDIDKNALRNFRVSRMSDVKANKAKEATPDYSIPSDFSLRAHAGSRPAWELGDSDSMDAVVQFRGETGAVRAASALGKETEAGRSPVAEGDKVGANAQYRTFNVRRMDSFARWLLSFAGDVVPIAPPLLVTEYATLVERTRAMYS